MDSLTEKAMRLGMTRAQIVVLQYGIDNDLSAHETRLVGEIADAIEADFDKRYGKAN